jgi:hypothetical protein
MKERLFANLSKKLNQLGFITVRFNWTPLTLEAPELEQMRAAADIYKITKSAQVEFNMPAEKTVLISKSFSTKALTPSISLAKTHILLTPNCSTAEPFQITYNNILNRNDISLSIFISNEDPYCDIHQIHDTLSTLTKTPNLYTTHGDHNFVMQSIPGQFDFAFQDQVINLVSSQISIDFSKKR